MKGIDFDQKIDNVKLEIESYNQKLLELDRIITENKNIIVSIDDQIQINKIKKQRIDPMWLNKVKRKKEHTQITVSEKNKERSIIEKQRSMLEMELKRLLASLRDIDHARIFANVAKEILDQDTYLKIWDKVNQLTED